MPQEDDEDAAYIYLDLADVKPPVNIREGDTVQLKGLDSQKPEIVLASGQRLVGKYEGSLGTQVFLELNTWAEDPAKVEARTFNLLAVSETTITFNEVSVAHQDATKPNVSKSQPKSKPTQAGSQPFSMPDMT